MLNLDAQITVALNHVLLAEPSFASLYNALCNNNFFRGAPFVAALTLVWFTRHGRGQIRLIVELLAVCVATLVSVRLQGLHLFHMRPMFAAELGLRLPPGLSTKDWLDSQPAWPSDTATLYAGLTAIVCREKPKLAVPLAAWTGLVILLPRIAFGYHYPSDILSGMALGAGAVALAALGFGFSDRLRGERPAVLLERYAVGANILFTIGLWQLADLMIDPRAVLRSLVVFLQH